MKILPEEVTPGLVAHMDARLFGRMPRKDLDAVKLEVMVQAHRREIPAARSGMER